MKLIAQLNKDLEALLQANSTAPELLRVLGSIAVVLADLDDRLSTAALPPAPPSGAE